MDPWGEPNDDLSAPIKSHWVFLHHELILYRNQTQPQCDNLPGYTHTHAVQLCAVHSYSLTDTYRCTQTYTLSFAF